MEPRAHYPASCTLQRDVLRCTRANGKIWSRNWSRKSSFDTHAPFAVARRVGLRSRAYVRASRISLFKVVVGRSARPRGPARRRTRACIARKSHACCSTSRRSSRLLSFTFLCMWRAARTTPKQARARTRTHARKHALARRHAHAHAQARARMLARARTHTGRRGSYPPHKDSRSIVISLRNFPRKCLMTRCIVFSNIAGRTSGRRRGQAQGGASVRRGLALFTRTLALCCARLPLSKRPWAERGDLGADIGKVRPMNRTRSSWRRRHMKQGAADGWAR
jgi:hypothetical protein